MHFRDLNDDVMHHVFSAVSRDCDLRNIEDYRELLAISAVCRSWRALVVPYLYKTAYIVCSNQFAESNARLVHRLSYAGHVRKLDIHFDASTDLVALLDYAGVTQAIWPRINKLSIVDYQTKNMNDAIASVDSAKATNGFIDSLATHVPNIMQIRYKCHGNSPSDWRRESEGKCPLLPKLVSRYPDSCIVRACFDIDITRLSSKFMYPQQLTHLTLSMSGREGRILPKVFTESLQLLEIRNTSPNITWNWFSSNEDDVWFKNLKRLSIWFSVERHTSPSTTYHTGSLHSVDMADFLSDYRDHVKRVRFPKLEALEVRSYPFSDGSFYRLFSDCPLKSVSVETPTGTQHYFPSDMMANLSHLDLKVGQAWSRVEGEQEVHLEAAQRKARYENELADMFLLPSSTIHTACVEVRHVKTLSLPLTLNWKSLQRIELGFCIDIPSVTVALAQLPRLRYLGFSIRAGHLISMYNENACRNPQIYQQQLEPNTRLEYMKIHIVHRKVDPRRAVMHFLSKILPLTPSLLKLDMNYRFGGAPEVAVADPAVLLQWISRQPEIMHRKGELTSCSIQ
ncbi:hypothetical protein GGI12_004932 [Dipsacomyces acuminosporus]|nr:hypothetical protein GGI12_004932 [Dipsacomyces acuminosporus]